MTSHSFIDHDRLFKELIQTFFEEFMILFFPEAYEEIDFRHTSFLSQEVFTDLMEGEKRRVDLLVETRLKGEEGLIIVHVEPQSYEQTGFNERMFIYFSRLYEKYRKRILPIAVFSYDKIREEADTFQLGFSFMDVLQFRFHKVELKKQNWRDYINQDNPVAAALLSKMGYYSAERVQVKMEFLRMLVRLELDPARQHLIAGFFDSYLSLEDEEERQLQQELKSLEHSEEAKIMELKTNWERRAEERAEKRAEERMMELKTNWEKKAERKAEVKGKVDIICMYLNTKFGESASLAQQKVSLIKDNELLDQISKEIFTTKSLEEALTVIETAVQEQISKGS